MTDSYKLFTRDVMFVAITNALVFVAGIWQVPLLTKCLNAQDYGVWVQAFVTVGLILPLTNLGVSSAMLRFLPNEKNQERIREDLYSVVTVIFGINLVVALAVIILAEPLATRFFDGNINAVRLTGVIVLLSSLYLLYLDVVRTFRQMKLYGAFIVAETYIQVGVMAYLVLHGYGITSVLLSVVVIKACLLVVIFVVVKARVKLVLPHFRRIKEFMSFGLPIVPKGIAFWLVGLSDRYVLAFFMGTMAVGIYSAAYGIATLPYTLVGILALALFAPISKLYDEGRMEEVKNHLSYCLKYYLVVTIPFVFGAAILAKPILVLYSTQAIADEGRYILPVLSLAVVFLGVNTIIYHILLLAKRTRLLSLIWIGAAVLNLGLNVVFIPRIGVMGAASTTLFAYAIALGLTTYYSYKELRFNMHWASFFKSIGASLVMSLVIWMLAYWQYPVLLVIAVGVVVYGTCFILLRGFSRVEIAFFRLNIRGMLRVGE